MSSKLIALTVAMVAVAATSTEATALPDFTWRKKPVAVWADEEQGPGRFNNAHPKPHYHAWEEEEEQEQEQGLRLKKLGRKLEKIAKRGIKIKETYDKAKEVGLLEDAEAFDRQPIYGCWDEDADEEQDEVQKLRWKKIVKGIKKVNNVINKAEQAGLLEEDQDADEEQRAKWKFDASVSGGHGRRPEWRASIGATWDEDGEQRSFFTKLDKTLDIVDRSVHSAHHVRALFDEEVGTEEKPNDKETIRKAVKAIRKIQKLGTEAADKGLLSKRSEERLRAKFSKLVTKIEHAHNVLTRQKQIQP